MLACVFHSLMILCWLLAATVGGPWLTLRWVALALALPVVFSWRLLGHRRVVVGGALLPLVVLVVYGVLLGFVSASPKLALVKSATYGTTALVCLLGATAWVELVGRDGFFAAWRWAWRALLAYSALAYATGSWRQGPEGLYGPTGNPNMFGSILLSFGLVLAVPAVSRRGRALAWAEAAIGLALLLATRARASLAAAGAATLVALVLGTSPRRWAWVSLVVAAFALALILTPDASVGAFANMAEGSTLRDIAATRTSVWSESWDAMVKGLPFGLGWGIKADAVEWQFDVKTLGFGREEGTSWLPIGEELGLPGLTIIVWLWARLALRVRKLPARPRVLGGAGLAAFFVLASLEGWFLSPGNWESMAFWSTIGVAFACSAREPAGIQQVPMQSPASALASTSS